MALTVATGFVVDDAIVVLENTSRHIEAGHGPLAGGAARRQGGRLHGALDQPVAGRGVHPAAVHGRPGRAAVPRVRGHAVGGGDDLARHLAHHHADDVRLAARAAAATRREAQAAGPPRALGRARLRARAARATRRSLDWALASQLAGAADPGRRGRRSTSICSSPCPRASSRSRTPASSTAACAPTRASRSQAMQAKLRQVVDIIQRDPAVDDRGRLHRRRRAGGGFMFVNLKPQSRAQGQRPGGDRAAAAAARPGDRHQPVPQPGAGRARRRPRRATRPTSTR